MDKEKEKQFTKAYTDFSTIIGRHIYYRVSNREVAEDLLQEVYIKAWQAATVRGEEIEDMKKYLYTIANNLIIDHYRQRPKQALYLEDMKNKAIVFHMDPEIEFLNKSEPSQIAKYLRLVRESYRRILEYYYIEDRSIEEISKLVNKSPNHVSVLKYRGVKMLKRHYGHAAVGV